MDNTIHVSIVLWSVLPGLKKKGFLFTSKDDTTAHHPRTTGTVPVVFLFNEEDKKK